MQDVSDAPSDAKLKDSPPLRIYHLMAWMAVTGALISGCMWFDRTARNGPPITDPVVIVSWIVVAIAVAAALTCFAFSFKWRRNGYEFPRQPGELLIVVSAKSALFVAAVIAGVLLTFFAIGDDDWIMPYFFFAMIFAVIGWARMNARGFARFADTTPWKYVYAMLIIAPGIVLPATLAGVWTVAPLMAVIACLVGAAGSDLRSQINRSWTHWLGVFVAVLLIAALTGLLSA
jgi:hypothetical protein